MRPYDGRYGYRRLHTLVAREGIVANHKRVHRFYREAGLQFRRPGERWSMDFMVHTLADGRGFRTLNIVDDFTRRSGGHARAHFKPPGGLPRRRQPKTRVRF